MINYFTLNNNTLYTYISVYSDVTITITIIVNYFVNYVFSLNTINNKVRKCKFNLYLIMAIFHKQLKNLCASLIKHKKKKVNLCDNTFKTVDLILNEQ